MRARRITSMLLVAAVLCLAVSVPRADEPPADLLARYLPANTVFYAQMPDLGGTITRGRDLALYKFIEEGNLLREAADAINMGLAGGGDPTIEFEKILTLLAEMKGPLSDAFTGRVEFALPGISGDMPVAALAFRVRDGRDEAAKEALMQFLTKLVQDVLPVGLLRLQNFEYKGVPLVGLLEGKDARENDAPWFCVTNGFGFLGSSKDALCQMVDMLAQPPEKNLLDFAPFRKGYSTTVFSDLFCYFSLDGTFQQLPQLRGDVAELLGERLPDVERGSLLYGVSFRGLAVEDNLLVDLNGGTWPLPLDFLLAESPCACASAGLFPADTAAYLCQSMSVARLFQAAKGGPFINLSADALKERGFDAETDLLPYLGPEVAFGLICRGAIPTGAFAIEMKDPDRVTAWVRNMATQLKDAFGEPADYKGALLIPCLDTDIPEIFGAMAIAIKDKWLLFGPILTLKSMLGAKEGAGLTTNADYSATIPPMLQKQPQTALFVNLRVLAGAYYTTLVSMLAQQGRKAAEIAMNLPTVERVQELAVPIAMSLRITSGDALLSSTSPAIICGAFPLTAVRAIPSTIMARRRAYEYAAMATVRAFGVAAAAEFAEKAVYWENGATDFSPYLADNNPPQGYSLKYFSNDTNGNGVAEATEFVFIAVPTGTIANRGVFYVDETGTFYQAHPVTGVQIEALQKLQEPDINWGDKIGSKIVIPDLDFLPQ